MEIDDSILALRALEEIMGPLPGVKHDWTYESLEIYDNIEKPSLEVFKAKYDDLKTRVVPFEELRLQRRYKLNETDWTVGSDSPLSPEKVQEWRTYRQALRDLPSVTEDPKNPTWPTPPE